jgi:pyruvate formate lyase activating enzyme
LTNGMPVSLTRAVEVVKQYRHSLRTMKGGLTVSGGEPLMQHRFLLKLFAAAKQLGVHTALDTNGSLGERLSDEDLNRIDLVMLGLKAITPDLHRRLTGTETEPVHAFARRLANLRRPAWVRFVVVPGWTDDLDEVGRMADFAAELGNVERVEVLPFHQLGRFKWERLGMQYQLQDAEPPSRAKIEEVITRFRTAGLNVV